MCLSVFGNLVVMIPFGAVRSHLLALPSATGEIHGALQVVRYRQSISVTLHSVIVDLATHYRGVLLDEHHVPSVVHHPHGFLLIDGHLEGVLVASRRRTNSRGS